MRYGIYEWEVTRQHGKVTVNLNEAAASDVAEGVSLLARRREKDGDVSWLAALAADIEVTP